MERFRLELQPPPEFTHYGEPLAIIEPPLRDLPFAEEDVDEWRPFESDPPEYQLTPELIRRAQVLVLTDDRVRERLGHSRYMLTGTSLRTVKGAPGVVVVTGYNYTENRAIEIYLDQEVQRVDEIIDVDYQPAPHREEVEYAVALARGDDRLRERLSVDLEGTAILVSPVNPEDKYYFHRMFDVRFGRPDERLPLYRALVDLSSETVIEAGPVEGHRH